MSVRQKIESPLNDREKLARVTNLQFQIPEVLYVLVRILNILFQGIIHKILIMYAYLTHIRTVLENGYSCFWFATV